MTSIYSPQLFSKLSSEWYLATALYDAIDDGNLREVSILLRDKHADPNVLIPDYDITPFHLAVGHENQLFAKEVTKLLLKNGADPNVKDTEGVTPLHVAAVWNRPTIVRLLLTYGGDPMITDDTEKNAFHHAYEEHAWETLKTLEIHRRAELKKSEDSDKSYNIQLDKVIIQGNGVQAEYRPLCEGCKKDVAVEKQSVATQTSPPSVHFKNDDIDSDILDAENILSTKIRPKCYDWCEQARDVALTEDCKRKIASHRAKGRVYEYNPLFERRLNQNPPPADQHTTNLSLCCANLPKTTSTCDVAFASKENLIELKKLTDATSTKPNGDFSEDSLNGGGADRTKDKESFFDTLNVPYIDESSPASSHNNCDDAKAAEPAAANGNIQPESAVPDSSVPDQQLKGKHVSWSGCLKTCACIPSRLNESDSSVYFTNAESDVEDKSKTEASLGISGVQKLSLPNESKVEPSSGRSGWAEGSQQSAQGAGDITEDRSLISNDESAPLPYEQNSLISEDGKPLRNYAAPPLKFAVEFKYTDDEDGIEFVEARLPLCFSSSNSNSSSSTPLKEKNVQNEQHNRSGRRADEYDTSDSATAYDTDYIREELKKLGFVSGPIAGSTKKLYLRKLRRIRKYVPEPEEPIDLKPIFSPELEHVLREDNDDWEKIITKWSSLEVELLNHFSDTSQSSSWRSGTAKTSFTYLLLDPRVSDNLPARCEQMDLGDVWRDFVHAIFYVGKGTRARPYEHLHEAFLVWKETKAYPRKRCNLKVRHILDIWKEGLGVVCLTAFHNIIPAEAYTREAAMIDAIGLCRLKNEKAGMYYGVAATWNAKLKRRLGTYLLYRAMRMFIADNEVQLKPTDVR